MADQEFKISVVSEADNTGFKSASEAVEDLAQTTAKGGEEDVAAAGEADKLSASKKQLKDAVKGLQLEFPILGRLANLALNPIAFSAALITSAFTIWRARAEELNTTLSNFKLPEISDRDITQISNIAKAWRDFGDAVEEAKGKINGAQGVYDKSIKNINDQAEAQHKLIAANKALELSRAKSPGERAEIEARYGAAGLVVDENAEKQRLGRLVEEKFNLETSAAAKLKKAAGMDVGFGGATAQDAADLKAQAETAEKEIAERRKRINDMGAFKDGVGDPMTAMAIKARQFTTGMSVDELIDLEKAGIDSAQNPIDRYKKFQRAQGINAERASLIESAGQDSAAAEDIGTRLPGAKAKASLDSSTNREVLSLQIQAQINGLNKQIDVLKEQVIAAANGGHKSDDLVVKAIRDLNESKIRMQRQIDEIRGNR